MADVGGPVEELVEELDGSELQEIAGMFTETELIEFASAEIYVMSKLPDAMMDPQKFAVDHAAICSAAVVFKNMTPDQQKVRRGLSLPPAIIGMRDVGDLRVSLTADASESPRGRPSGERGSLGRGFTAAPCADMGARGGKHRNGLTKRTSWSG